MTESLEKLRGLLIETLTSGAVKESDGADWPYDQTEAEHIADTLLPAIEAEIWSAKNYTLPDGETMTSDELFAAWQRAKKSKQAAVEAEREAIAYILEMSPTYQKHCQQPKLCHCEMCAYVRGNVAEIRSRGTTDALAAALEEAERKGAQNEGRRFSEERRTLMGVIHGLRESIAELEKEAERKRRVDAYKDCRLRERTHNNFEPDNCNCWICKCIAELEKGAK